MSTPAANAVGRTEAVVANLLNREISVGDPDDLALLLRVVNAFASHWQAQFDAFVADPESPTNTELATWFLLKMTKHGKAILRSEAETSKRATLASDITDAGDSAVLDLE